jgi:hypothetical protein
MPDGKREKQPEETSGCFPPLQRTGSRRFFSPERRSAVCKSRQMKMKNFSGQKIIEK